MILVFGGPEINKEQRIGMKLGSSGAAENMDLGCRFQDDKST